MIRSPFAMILGFVTPLLLLGGVGLFLMNQKEASLSQNSLQSTAPGLNAPAQSIISTREQRALLENDFAYFVGPTNARVTVVEFLDFQCPFCKQSAPTIHQLMERYRTAPVKFVFRHLPIANIHPFAFDASHASLCARDQNQFLEFHDFLYINQESIGRVPFSKFAESLGLDRIRFNRCMEQRPYDALIRKDLSDALKLGIRGTPTFFINNDMFAGALPFEDLASAIDAALAR